MSTFMDGLHRSLQARPALIETGQRFAAVAIILREYHDSPQVLLIQRAARHGDPWSGHLAFPGGRADAADPDLLATAVRETAEEVGVDLAACARPLGPLDQLAARGVERGLVVAPFAFWLERDVLLQPNQEEVSDAFWAELSPLASGTENTSYPVRRGQETHHFPAYKVNDQILWGMTYYMLQPVLAALHGGPHDRKTNTNP